MGMFFTIVLIILAVLLAVYLVYYISTLSERREIKELLKDVSALYEDKFRAERAKHVARTAGTNARDEIDRIAGL